MNRPFSVPPSIGRDPRLVPHSSWGFINWDSTLQDPDYIESYLNIATGEAFASDGLANNGDWNAFQGSVEPIIQRAQGINRPLLSISFPAFPDSVGGTMTQAGAGAYVTNWKDAITPIAQLYPGACWRFCVELDGSWFAFGYAHTTGSPPVFTNNQSTYAADFVKAITLFSQTLKGIDPTAKVIFNTHYDASERMPNGLWQSCVTGCAPGVIDGIAIDIYDDSGYADPDPTHRWINTVQPTLNDMSALSLQTGLPIAIPEFGPGYCLMPEGGGGPDFTPDNPQWFRLLYAFMVYNPISYWVIWNASDNGNIQWGSGMRAVWGHLFTRPKF